MYQNECKDKINKKMILVVLMGVIILMTPGCLNFGPPLSEVVIGHWYCAEMDEYINFSENGTIRRTLRQSHRLLLYIQ